VTGSARVGDLFINGHKTHWIEFTEGPTCSPPLWEMKKLPKKPSSRHMDFKKQKKNCCRLIS
jgi:hypothetical protein